MWSLGPHCGTLRRGYRFRDPQWEAAFQARSQQWALAPVRVYVVIVLTVTTINLVDYRRYFAAQPGFFVQLATGIASSLLFCGTFCSNAIRRHIILIFAWFCFAVGVSYCYLLLENTQEWGDFAMAHHLPGLLSLAEDNALRRQSEAFVRGEVAKEAAYSTLLWSFNHWVALAVVGFNPHAVGAFVGIYVPLTAMLAVGPPGQVAASRMAIATATVASLGCLYFSVLVARLRRQSFLTEALLMREMQAAQMADSILNHTLKNLLADVAASLEVYLAGEAPSGTLEDSVTCLRRGMMACKERQVYLKLVSGQYAPVSQEVNLRDFGRELAAGRNVQLEAVDLSVYLDSTICHLILENALSNAIRHGHPQNPQVKLVIEARDQEANLTTGRQRIRFSVENIANPARPPLTPEAVAQLFRGQANLVPHDHIPTLSDRVGIVHCVMAAQLGGLTLSLAQEGDVVRFCATLDAAAVPQPSASVTLAWSSSSLTLQFPTDLCFCCMDDSHAALRLLDLHIRRWCTPAAVHLFGRSEEDVHHFVPFALEHADVVILDQQLEFSRTYRGTDLVRELREKGFAGLVCIRSADDAAPAQAQFRSAGAHCCFGKDVPGCRMMDEIKAAYVQLRRSSSPGMLETQALVRAESVSSAYSPTPWTTEHPCHGFGILHSTDLPHP